MEFLSSLSSEPGSLDIPPRSLNKSLLHAFNVYYIYMHTYNKDGIAVPYMFLKCAKYSGNKDFVSINVKVQPHGFHLKDTRSETYMVRGITLRHRKRAGLLL